MKSKLIPHKVGNRSGMGGQAAFEQALQRPARREEWRRAVGNARCAPCWVMSRRS